MKKLTIILIVFACLTTVLLSTCKKETTNGTSTLAVRLKDAPASWERCMVHVKGVRLHSSTEGWITIPINDTLIDILKLQDTSVFLGSVNLHGGTITEVHLMLGQNNSITIGGVTFVVSVLPGDGDDIMIKVSDALVAGANSTLVLDLDAAESFRFGDDGRWHMHGFLNHFFRRDHDDGHHGHDH